MIAVEPLHAPSLFDLAYRAASLAARFAPGSDRDKARLVLRNVLVLRDAMSQLALYIGGPLLEHDPVLQGLTEVFLLERTYELQADDGMRLVVHPDIDGHQQRFGSSAGHESNTFWLGYLKITMVTDRETVREESAFDFLQRAAMTAETYKHGEEVMLRHFENPGDA